MSAPDADADPLLTDAAEEDLGLENPNSRRYLYAPMSYDEMITDMRPRWSPLYWYDIARQNRHMLDVFRPPESVVLAFGKVRSALRAMWPQNRAQQAILVMIALWFFITYAEWTTEVLFPDDMLLLTSPWNREGQYENLLRDVHIEPLPEDGSVVENATWSNHICKSTGRPLREPGAIQCAKWTNFYVDPYPDARSIGTSDNNFLYIDPPRKGPRTSLIGRDEREQPHGAAPARVYVVSAPPNNELPEEHRGKVGINVTAIYDESAWMLADSSLVARLQRGRFSSGVEILTPEVRLNEVLFRNHESIRFEVFVTVPADQSVDGFVFEGAKAKVHAFTDAAQSRWAQLMHKPVPALSGERVFGDLSVETNYGAIALGSKIRAVGTIAAVSQFGDVSIIGNISAPSVMIQSNAGNMRVHEGCGIYGGLDTSIKLRDGSILVDKGSQIWGTALSFTTERGSVLGPGVWFVNHTLSLHSGTGSIGAAIGVHKPDMFYITYDDQKKEGKGRLLSVDITTEDGSIDANYVQHLATMPLRSYARSERGAVRVKHAREFEGKIDARGSSAYLRAAKSAGRTIDTSNQRVGSVQELTGSVSWDASARPQLPKELAKPWDDGTPPADLGAKTIAESGSGSVEIVIAK